MPSPTPRTGLAGALLVGASVAHGLAYALGVPALGIHHLEGHLLAPLMEKPAPQFPFVALLVSGGHTQLMRVAGVGAYELLGDTLDDAAGEAFDKTAQLLGLGYPGGPEIAQLAQHGQPGCISLPRPMLHSGDLDFSFSGLKTAVLMHVKGRNLDAQGRADVAAEFRLRLSGAVAKSLARSRTRATGWSAGPASAPGRARARCASRRRVIPGVDLSGAGILHRQWRE
jgi:N6-L-threonylcarbamoyladenine synthase